MKVLNEATVLVPYSFVRLAHIYNTYDRWFKEISKTATNPDFWTMAKYLQLQNEIEIKEESDGVFIIPNLKFARIMNTNDFGSVLLLSKDKILLASIDYH